MRRQVIIGATAGTGAIALIGLMVFISQQGLFGAKPHRLLGAARRAAESKAYPEAQAKLEELIATYPDSPWTDDALLTLGEVYEGQQQYEEARNAYRTLLERFPDSPLMAKTQTQLGRVNISLLFSPIVTEQDLSYQVRPGDTLGKIAKANGTTVEFIKRANGLKQDVIRAGQALKVPKGRFSIVVDKSQYQLLLTQDNQFIKTYPVATGKETSPTPVGTFKIVNRLPNPVWYKQNAVVPADSPENILGTRWLGLDKQGYGIHGSEDPGAIGKQATAGCVRLSNSDVEELFDIVPVGTEVTIVE